MTAVSVCLPTRALESALPVADLYENDQQLKLEVELPGVNKEDVQLEIKDGLLHLKAKRRAAAEGFRPVYQERDADGFERSFRLGEGVDVSRVKASFELGRLVVTLSKAEKALSRGIAID
jgi:HSP20 family protein